MRCEEKYKELYEKDPEAIAVCPYRIAPLGAHIDHQLGAINGFAIDKGIYIAYGKKESGICEIRSLQFPKRAQFHINDIPEVKVGDWADHCRGAAKELGEKLTAAGGRVEVYEQNEPMRVKIAKAQAQKVPYMIVLGDKEIENGTISVRDRFEGDKGTWPGQHMVDLIADAVV